MKYAIEIRAIAESDQEYVNIFKGVMVAMEIMSGRTDAKTIQVTVEEIKDEA